MVQFYRARVVSTGIQGSPYLSTLNFLESGSTPAGVSTAINGFFDALTVFQNQDLIWDFDGTLDVVESSTGELQGVVSATAQTGQGTLSTEVLPPATQGLIQWRTGVFTGGREIRGKTFVPALTELAASAGQVVGPTQSGLQNAATALVGTPSAQLAIYSRRYNTIAAVSDSSVWNQFAVLRSRRD